MADDKPKPLMTRLFHGCLLLLGAVITLWIAVSILERFWGWLVLAAVLVLLAFGVIYGLRWWRDRHW